ncbi:DEAD-box ATP-dependent RNA helicase 3B, chloroplastic, partial [Sesamum angolense]
HLCIVPAEQDVQEKKVQTFRYSPVARGGLSNLLSVVLGGLIFRILTLSFPLFPMLCTVSISTIFCPDCALWELADVVHYELPNDPEIFVHRSGQKGSAGKDGTAVLMITSSQRRTVKSLERGVGCKLEFISPPSVPESFGIMSRARVDALAAALASLSGFSQPSSSRSLIIHEQHCPLLHGVRFELFLYRFRVLISMLSSSGCFRVSYATQESALSCGVDVVVVTPGRIIDLINNNSLKLGEVQYLALDEADRTIAIGAEEEKLAEGIKLYAIPPTATSKRTILCDLVTVHAKGGKTIVFKQTKWDADEVWLALTNDIASEALHGDISHYQRGLMINGFKQGKLRVLVATDVAALGLDIPNVDLVGAQEEKLAEGIKLYAIRSIATSKRTILGNLETVYAKGGKSIVFTQTKCDADEVWQGKFRVLVDTDVAARGLDILNADLVVHYERTNDPESFVHRSGRTGRAGKDGKENLEFFSPLMLLLGGSIFRMLTLLFIMNFQTTQRHLCIVPAEQDVEEKTVYAKGGKAIVIALTKWDADEVWLALTNSIALEALHGDISHHQRGLTLNGFRRGKFRVLVATDVAARGLDIPNVDLCGVHPESAEYLTPTAQKFFEQQGVDALAAALASLSGFSQPPSSRSLITHEQVVDFVMHRFHLIMSRGFRNSCALCWGQGEGMELCAVAMAQTGHFLVGRVLMVCFDGVVFLGICGDPEDRLPKL